MNAKRNFLALLNYRHCVRGDKGDRVVKRAVVVAGDNVVKDLREILGSDLAKQGL